MNKVYAEQIQLFLKGLLKLGEHGGYTISDVRNVFSNPTFDNIVFREI